MKKNTLTLLLCCISSTLLFSQTITILDESPQISSTALNDFVVYDNDILYTKNSASSGFVPLTRINYGIPGSYVDFNLEGSFGLSDHKTVSGFQFYQTNQKKIGSKIILQSAFNGVYNGTIFSLNSSRSGVLIEPIFNNNFSLIGKDRAISTRVEEDLTTNNDYIIVTLHTPTETQEFALPPYLTFGLPGGYFLWNDNLYFTAEDGSGGRELFKTDAFQTTRITKLRVPNNSNSTSPSSFYNRDLDKLYFSGNYKIFNTPPQTGSTNLGRELCYATGNVDLGNTETYVSGNDDGSTGYIAFQTGVPSPTNYSGSVPLLLGKANDNLIYYAMNNYMRKFYSHPGNVDLMLETPNNLNLGDLEYLEFNNKVYISYLPDNSLNGASLFETDGTVDGTISIPVPTINSGGAVVSPFRILDMFIHNDKIYYKALYNTTSPSSTFKFIEYNPITQQSVILFEFPAGSGTLLKPYTSGFVFNGNGKLYGWNIENRAAVMPLSIDEPLQSVQFTYNGLSYNFGIDSVQAIPIPDQLKINLLDYFSIPYEFIISSSENQGRMQDEDVQLSKLFYSLTAFDEATFYTTNLTLGYDESMFGSTSSINPNQLSVKAFSNGEWITKNIISVDSVNKTVTINDTFNHEEYLFFEYGQTLGMNGNQQSKITIYPNPASETITIQLQENIHHAVFITDISGKTVSQHTLFATSTLDISQLATGIYIIKIQKENGLSYNHKLIVN